jgi:Flp pilus assembly protein TadG
MSATPRRPTREKEKGVALVEAAMTIPLLLLVAVGIFEFGRAYQFWQVLTNAAREAARYSVTPASTVPQAQSVALTYMNAGGVTGCTASCITVNKNVALPVGGATNVTIQYPFQFILIQPIANMVTGNTSSMPNALTMTATATMRNEAP